MNLSRKKPRHFLAAVFGIFAVAIATSGHAQPSIASDVLEIHAALDVMCRGGLGDMRSTEQACDVRLKVERLLGKLSYCYGTQDDLALTAAVEQAQSGINAPIKAYTALNEPARPLHRDGD